jgi:hypothetical protein
MSVDLSQIVVEACREVFRDPAVVRAMRDASADVWLTLDEAAEIAKVAPRVLRDAGRAGKLVLGSAGSEPRVTRREVDRWLATTPAKKPRKARPRAEESREAVSPARGGVLPRMTRGAHASMHENAGRRVG